MENFAACVLEALLIALATGVTSYMAQDVLTLKSAQNILSSMKGPFPTIEDTAALLCHRYSASSLIKEQKN